MGSISQNIERIKSAKANIKQAITNKGVVVGSEKIDQYAGLIGQIDTDKEPCMPCRLPATAITLAGYGSVSTNKHIKVRGNDNKSYTIEQWHALTGKGTTIKPVGFDMEAWGEHFVWYFKTKYRDDASLNKDYYDVSGTSKQSNGCLRHSQWQHPLITGSYTKTDTNGKVASAVVSGTTITLSTTNSPFTWTMKTNCGSVYAFLSDNVRDRYEALVAQTEWFRHRVALNSGLATSEADGTIGVVTIKNESGEEPSVGEDMYFWVNGQNTGKLAKYNLHAMMSGDNPTQAIIDTIYDKQKANGTHMNRACANGDAKPVVTEGAKGAEAYAFNGVWMIVTPILTRCSSNTSLDYNIPDAPCVSYMNWLRTYYGNAEIFMPNKRMLQAYWVNRGTILNSMVSYLNSSAGGACGVPSTIDTDTWSSLRLSGFYAWFVGMYYGYLTYSSVGTRFVGVGVSAL